MTLSDIYGGSNRTQHLALNADVVKDLTIASRIAAGGVLVLGIWQQWGSVDVLLRCLCALTLPPVACRTQELWASPDRDLQENRGKGLGKYANYWYLYGRTVKHRSIWSHSALGTACRCLYGYWPALGLLLLPGAVWMPIFGAWMIGVIASDVAHYALDNFSPIEMLLGKAP
ncbi:MAG: DUF2227 family putative metal-binding protein [Cyanobacteria bacterium P01_C01_bin.120]